MPARVRGSCRPGQPRGGSAAGSAIRKMTSAVSGEEEPLDGVGDVVVRHVARLSAARSAPGPARHWRRRAGSDACGRETISPATAPPRHAGIVGPGRPADVDLHARPFGAGTAGGDMAPARLVLEVAAGDRAPADRLQAEAARPAIEEAVVADRRQCRPGHRRQLRRWPRNGRSARSSTSRGGSARCRARPSTATAAATTMVGMTGNRITRSSRSGLPAPGAGTPARAAGPWRRAARRSPPPSSAAARAGRGPTRAARS